MYTWLINIQLEDWKKKVNQRSSSIDILKFKFSLLNFWNVLFLAIMKSYSVLKIALYV